MNKEIYDAVELEIMEFINEDVIVTSDTPPTDPEGSPIVN